MQISLFFRSELALPRTELYPRDFQKTENRRNWRSLVPKKLRGRGFELKWRCFVRVPWVLPRAEKKARGFEKTEKNEQKSAKKRDFLEKNKLNPL